MSFSDVDDGFIRNVFDCWIEVDGVKMRSGADFLCEGRCTLTKVVLPVPDMPMTIRQVFVSGCWLIRVDIIILPLL